VIPVLCRFMPDGRRKCFAVNGRGAVGVFLALAALGGVIGIIVVFDLGTACGQEVFALHPLRQLPQSW
jgi:hypothetical protein